MPLHSQDPYAVLGLRSSATQAEITRAYRSLLRQNHPDTRAPARSGQPTADSDAMLQRVLAAYAVLGHPDQRAAYDRQQQHLRHRAAQPAPPIQAGPVRWEQPASAAPAHGPLETLLDMLLRS